MSQYSIGFILYLITIFISSFVILLETNRIEATKKAYALWILQFLSIAWLVTGMVENLSTSNSELFYSIRFTLFPISYIGAIFLIFAMDYAAFLEESIVITRSTIGRFLLALSTFFYFPVLTKAYFHLIIKYKDISNIGYTEWGPFFMIQYRLSILYILLGMFLIIKKRLQEDKTHPNTSKIDLILFFVGIFIPFASNLFNWYLESPQSYDITPLFFALSNILLAISVLKFNFLNTTVEDIDSIYVNEYNMAILFNHDFSIRRISPSLKDWLKHKKLESLLEDSSEIQTFLNVKSIDWKRLQYKKHFNLAIKNIKTEDSIIDCHLENITVENTIYGIALSLADQDIYNPDVYFKPREFLESMALDLKYLNTLNAVLNNHPLETYALIEKITYAQAKDNMTILFKATIGRDFTGMEDYKLLQDLYEKYSLF